MKKLFYLTAIFIISISSALFSQDSLRNFGIGLHVEQFKLIDLGMNNSIIPSNKVIFTFNLKSKYRMEPVAGLIRYKNDEESSTGFHIGLGSYRLLRKEKTIIFLGFKTGYDNIFTEEKRSGYSSEMYQTKEKRFSFGPAIGGEYFFGKHFSLAGEAGLLYFYTKVNDNNDSYNSKDETIKHLLTDTGLILRFYF
ncbi:MAG: hypothetical protein HC905_23275 [Bacteroidales bacterium]|nr:hypothetical protein [Bacteroidales bacterium]